MIAFRVIDYRYESIPIDKTKLNFKVERYTEKLIYGKKD